MDVLGSFLEGAFAPLAFLWLVIGLFIQQNQLARNTDELRRTNEQSIKQTEAIAATERNARQEAFFKISENVQKQLNSIAGMILISNKGQVGDGTYSEVELAEFWRQHTSGTTNSLRVSCSTALLATRLCCRTCFLVPPYDKNTQKIT